MNYEFTKLSYCEMCYNNTCGNRGKRNIHFTGKNRCTCYKDQPVSKKEAIPAWNKEISYNEF